MTVRPETPAAPVADAIHGNWVDHRAPAWTRPYLRLSRADRPIGTWLLLLPCWWATLLAAASSTGANWRMAWILLGCSLGAWLMRGAGCTWNDITDRHIDGRVARTRSRPIPSGQVSVSGAVIWMGLQALVAFGILLTFSTTAILLGIGSLALVAIYPFAKRFTWWPQIFLGLAFNWGAVLAWTAQDGRLGWPAVFLYIGGIFWTLFYDTIYAHQDKEDDALIGVKSTARLFGNRTGLWLWRFQIATVACLAIAVGMAFGPGGATAPLLTSLAGVAGVGMHLAWQLRGLDTDNTDACLRIFRSNRDTGLILALFFAVAVAL
ncbi:4-hydroxybenzoate octaprenyltransferase [Pseudoruegeria sp. SK021]|uniref:4-hydroxybenzoate octaprenyltransferase n=1 Tax=Pseudoruegeria sp. SK021 TaxID=1933035 RepID=UPI000A2261D9|nr:4-hydroxybenzoate octaprenyltransferase [Pseudoruegeria sp. SK021]OSP55713.1 4-hydroxybenzoate polyprenyltransferase [Pseudoruegeria sp. SK021]